MDTLTDFQRRLEPTGTISVSTTGLSPAGFYGMRQPCAPFRLKPKHAAVGINDQLPIQRRAKNETGARSQFVNVFDEMMFGSGVAQRFPMKIPIFDINPGGQFHCQRIQFFRFEGRRGISAAAAPKSSEVFPWNIGGFQASTPNNGGIEFVDHIDADFDRGPITATRVQQIAPDRGRSGGKGNQIILVQRQDQMFDLDPKPHPFRQHMPVHRRAVVQIRRQ